jgi:hypothetical protein
MLGVISDQRGAISEKLKELSAKFTNSSSRIAVPNILVSMIIAGIATFTWTGGFFWYFVAIELLVAICLYAAMYFKLSRKRWALAD